MGGQLKMALANDLQEVARVIDQLESFCVEEDIAPQQGLRFCLALDELITNTMSHGLVGSDNGVIILTVQYTDGALHAELVDNGPQFDPFAANVHVPSGSVEDREVGGLGIALVKAVMDRLDYRREGEFNRLKMEMKLPVA